MWAQAWQWGWRFRWLGWGAAEAGEAEGAALTGKASLQDLEPSRVEKEPEREGRSEGPGTPKGSVYPALPPSWSENQEVGGDQGDDKAQSQAGQKRTRGQTEVAATALS